MIIELILVQISRLVVMGIIAETTINATCHRRRFCTYLKISQTITGYFPYLFFLQFTSQLIIHNEQKKLISYLLDIAGKESKPLSPFLLLLKNCFQFSTLFSFGNVTCSTFATLLLVLKGLGHRNLTQINNILCFFFYFYMPFWCLNLKLKTYLTLGFSFTLCFVQYGRLEKYTLHPPLDSAPSPDIYSICPRAMYNFQVLLLENTARPQTSACQCSYLA